MHGLILQLAALVVEDCIVHKYGIDSLLTRPYRLQDERAS